MAESKAKGHGGRQELEAELKRLDIKTMTVEHPEVNFKKIPEVL